MSGVVGPRLSTILPLDLPGITDDLLGAWSLRKLNTTYVGDCCIIYSGSSGQYSSSIGFTNEGYIDTQSILDFVGPGGGAKVGTWYDQSGNGNDFTNGSYANMLSIISGGNFFTKGDFIYLNEGGRQQLTAGFTQINVGESRTVFSVHHHNLSNTNRVWSLYRNAGVVVQYLSSNSNREIILYDRLSSPPLISGSAQFDLGAFNLTTAIMQASPNETAVYYKGSKVFSSTNRVLDYSFKFQTPDTTNSVDNSDAVEYFLYSGSKSDIREELETNINRYYGL